MAEAAVAAADPAANAPWLKYQTGAGFGAGASSGAAAAAQGPWTKYAQQSVSAEPATPVTTLSGLAKSAGAGITEGITGMLGAFSDSGAGEELRALGRDDIADQNPAPGTGGHLVNQSLGSFNPENIESKTLPEKLARAGGAGLVGAFIPGGEAAFGVKAVENTLAGVGGELMSENVPDFLKPVARVLGGILGGNLRQLPAVARSVPGIINSVEAGVNKATTRLFGPYTNAERERVVGEKIQGAAADPEQLQRTLDEGAHQTSEGAGYDAAVPGSRPTTFQQSGDMGIGELDRTVQKDNPAVYIDNAANQNNARRMQLEQLQSTGNSQDLADFVKAQVRQIDEQTEREVGAATQTAQAHTTALGGNRTPEDYGAALRDPAQEARNAAREHESALWKAVDPDGKLIVNGGPVRLQANKLLAEHPDSALPISGAEKHILDAASNYGTTVPFRELTALRSSVNDAMSEEMRSAGRTQTWGRLAQMRGAIERSMDSAIDTQAAKATAAPQIAPFETPVSPPLQTPEPANVGVPIDAGARQRFAEATQATRERATTFDEGPVGRILASSGRTGEYKIGDSAVPATIFRAGPQGAETIASYRAAVGDGQAMTDLQDAAASSLKRVAMNSDGTLNPTKTTTWLRQHTDALRAFPALEARFRNAATATTAIEEISAARRVISDAAEDGALGKILGLRTPEDVTRTIGGIMGSAERVGQMRTLAQNAAADPAAQQGLRRAVAQVMLGKLIGNTEAGTSGTTQIKADVFQTFMRENDAMLREVFTHEEVESLHGIAADIQQSNRTVKLPGQSNTVQDLAADARLGRNSVLSALLSSMGKATTLGVGYLTHGPLGAIVAHFGANAINDLRAHNINSEKELLLKAMLDPGVAHELLRKLPVKPTPAMQAANAARLHSALENIGRSAVSGLLSGVATVNDDTGTQRQGLINSAQ